MANKNKTYQNTANKKKFLDNVNIKKVSVLLIVSSIVLVVIILPGIGLTKGALSNSTIDKVINEILGGAGKILFALLKNPLFYLFTLPYTLPFLWNGAIKGIDTYRARFAPKASFEKILKDLGLDPETLQKTYDDAKTKDETLTVEDFTKKVIRDIHQKNIDMEASRLQNEVNTGKATTSEAGTQMDGFFDKETRDNEEDGGDTEEPLEEPKIIDPKKYV